MVQRDFSLILTFIGLAKSSFPTCPEGLRAQGTSVFFTRCNLEEFTIFLEPQCYASITNESSHVDPDKWIITSYKASEVEGFDATVNQTCTRTKQTGQQTYWLNSERQDGVVADSFSFQHSDCGEIELENSGEGTDSYYEVWISQLDDEVITGEWNVRCVIQNEEHNAAEYNVNTTRDASFDSTGLVNALALEIQSLENEAARLGELQKVVVKTTASSAKFNENFDFRLDRCWGSNGESGQSEKYKSMVIFGDQLSGCPSSPIITSYTPQDFEFRTFKFPGSDTVRIQCEVKICEKNESGCEDPDCSGNARKRRSTETGGQRHLLTEASFFHENDV